MPYRFIVSTDSPDLLDLRGLCERHVAELWIPEHLLPHEVEEFVLDHFKRTVLADLHLLAVQVERPEWLDEPQPPDDT